MQNDPIIAPLSIIQLVRADRKTPQWKKHIGRTFRVGYYSRQDGTDCVWLVNDSGQYEQTIDQKQLLDYFQIIERSKERALYGVNRPPIPALQSNGHNHSNGAVKSRVKPQPHALR